MDKSKNCKDHDYKEKTLKCHCEDMEEIKNILISFGKYHDKSISEIPHEYLKWIFGTGNSNVSPELYHKMQLYFNSNSDSVEKVNHPSHYQGQKYEVIDIIEDFRLGFNLGNAVKYILRAGKKGFFLEDIKKAIWYLDREINHPS